MLEFARETDFGRDRKRLTEMETGFADERRRALSHPRGDTDLELAGSPRSAAQRRVPATTGRQQG